MAIENKQSRWPEFPAFRNIYYGVLIIVSTIAMSGCCWNGCKIGAVCYGNGVSNPANSCQLCDVANSKTTWTNAAAGASCDYCLHCSAGGTCTEKDENCCSTQDVLEGYCVEGPNILVQQGCLFSHDMWGDSNQITSGLYVDLICEAGGNFGLHQISHSTIQHCSQCPDNMHERWYTSECGVAFETETYSCSEPMSAEGTDDSTASESSVRTVYKKSAPPEKQCADGEECRTVDPAINSCTDAFELQMRGDCLFSTQCVLLEDNTRIEKTSKVACIPGGKFPNIDKKVNSKPIPIGPRSVK